MKTTNLIFEKERQRVQKLKNKSSNMGLVCSSIILIVGMINSDEPVLMTLGILMIGFFMVNKLNK